MPEFIAIPETVGNQRELVRYISDLKDIAPSEVWKLIMRVIDLKDEAFKLHPSLIAQNDTGCILFRLQGKNRVFNGKFFKKGQVVALYGKADPLPTPRKKRVSYFDSCRGMHRRVA